MFAIEADGLERRYRSKTGLRHRSSKDILAVDNISFQVEQGELFGLLGPNGAGKTTSIKMLTTLLLPTAGHARILGLDVVTHARQVRSRIGYVFGGDRGLYERLSGLDNLRYFAELYGIPPREQRERIGSLLQLVGLAGRERERVEGYSRGMRQRLHIARGLLHRPEVVFLDEPSIGIDPVGARELRATIASLKATGMTVLLTTHYMFEAEELCDRIAVISGGKIVASGTPQDLKRNTGRGSVLEVEAYGVDDEVIEIIRALPEVDAVDVQERGQAQVLIIRSGRSAEAAHRVLACLDGVRLGQVCTREPTLEDAYVELVRVQ
jgi:ABC-2 type transport system ATP-binding protein